MRSLFSLMILTFMIALVGCQPNTKADGTSETTSANATPANGNDASAATTGPATAQTVGSGNEVVTTAGPTTTLMLDKSEYDFGNVKEGDIVETTIKVTNTGKEPLVISNCHASCGCTTPKCPTSPVAPGQAVDVPVKFDTKGKGGAQSKEVTITANTVPAQTKFKLHGDVMKAEAAN